MTTQTEFIEKYNEDLKINKESFEKMTTLLENYKEQADELINKVDAVVAEVEKVKDVVAKVEELKVEVEEIKKAETPATEEGETINDKKPVVEEASVDDEKPLKEEIDELKQKVADLEKGNSTEEAKVDEKDKKAAEPMAENNNTKMLLTNYNSNDAAKEDNLKEMFKKRLN